MKKIIFLISMLFVSNVTFSQDDSIFEAVKTNNIEKVDSLLKICPEIVKLRDEYARTPLHWSARGVYIQIMEKLLDAGANSNAKDINGTTPLISIVARNNVEAAKLLIKYNAIITEPDLEGDYLVHIAATYGHADLVKFLIDMQNDLLDIRNDRDRTPLILACRESGDFETVNYLISKGADINATDKFGGSALSLSAWRGYETIVNLLLEKEAKFSVTGITGSKLLQYACSKNLTKLYFAIVSNGGYIDSLEIEGQHAIHWTAMGGSSLIMKNLIDNKSNVDLLDVYGWAPIHYAAYFGKDSIISLLRENGANLNVKTPLNESAIFIAKQNENENILKLLEENGLKQTGDINTGINGKYFGQKPNESKSTIFAPGIVSRLQGGHSNISFSKDGKTAFWTEWNLTEKGYADGSKILFSKQINGGWIYPKVIVPKGDCPVLSPDGGKLYFFAELKTDLYKEGKRGIWYFDVQDTTFSNPVYLAFDVDKYGLYWQFSFDSSGNLFFGGLHGLSRALYINNKFLEPEKLSDIWHPDYDGGSPYIAPDGSFIMFNTSDLSDSYGSSDIYIGFKKEGGSWSKPVNMGSSINSEKSELLPMCSLDGKYLFFVSNFGYIKWISTDVIDKLRIN